MTFAEKCILQRLISILGIVDSAADRYMTGNTVFADSLTELCRGLLQCATMNARGLWGFSINYESLPKLKRRETSRRFYVPSRLLAKPSLLSPGYLPFNGWFFRERKQYGNCHIWIRRTTFTSKVSSIYVFCGWSRCKAIIQAVAKLLSIMVLQ